MPDWVITPEDLKKGDLAEVGWHPAKIVKYEEGEAGEDAKNPGSTTCTFHFEILDGPSKGIQPRRLFSETAWGFAKNFFAAMNFPKDEKGNYKISTKLFEQTVGHNLMIYIKRGKSNKGNEFNDVVDFKPMSQFDLSGMLQIIVASQTTLPTGSQELLDELRDSPQKQDWIKTAVMIHQFHILKLRDNPRWRIEDSAKALNRSFGSTCQYLQIASWLKTHENQITRCETMKDAVAFIKRHKRIQQLEDIEGVS